MNAPMAVWHEHECNDYHDGECSQCSSEASSDMDQCDRCHKDVPGKKLWIGHDWIATLGFDAVCDECMVQLSRTNPSSE